MRKKPTVSIIIATYNRKKDIDLCLKSIFKSHYKTYETIVVDNASTDGTASFLEKRYGKRIRLIKSKKNLMAGGGRNLGANFSRGKYLLFIDSDNVIDKNMIKELVTSFESLNNVGMVGPLMYYYNDPERIWWAGAEINMLTSKTSYIGKNEIDNNQFNRIIRVGHIPNVFMVKKDIWNLVKGISEEYVMHYEESDLAKKIKNVGYELYLINKAKTWHNVPPYNLDQVSIYGGESEERTFYTARNRVIFMKKNSSPINYVLFILFFLPLFTLFYSFKLIKFRKFKLFKTYIEGTMGGLFYRSKKNV